ncbi:hypothetical protein BSG1_00655 [Bacillus sp. SG-1]|nr:hypothetical protein BSG1_00655 [Bacillus sp. SG-1]
MTGETEVTYPLERNPASAAEKAHRPPPGLERKSTIFFHDTYTIKPLKRGFFINFTAFSCPSVYLYLNKLYNKIKRLNFLISPKTIFY